MEELISFVTLAQTERFTLTELCEQFGISRKTAYKHLERYALGGFKALGPRSSRPLRSPARTLNGKSLAQCRHGLTISKQGPNGSLNGPTYFA
jgi:hypothetical protein